MQLAQLQKDSWKTAEEKGFHDQQVNLPPETLALYLRCFLTAGELSEAGEELRDGHEPTEIYYEYDITGAPGGAGIIIADKPFCLLPKEHARATYFYESMDDLEDAGMEGLIMAGKPAGFGIELADCLIRLCDLAETAGVDLTLCTEVKARYNKTRAFLHGKKA